VRRWPAALLGVLTLAAPAAASDVSQAVAALAARLAAARVVDLSVDQTITLYHPDGRHVQATGRQQVHFRAPDRQRVEQVVAGRREVWLVVGDRIWVGGADGRVTERPPGSGDGLRVFAPVARGAEALLAEWRALGIRADVSHTLSWQGRPVLVIGARPGDRTSPAVWLDEAYGVVRLITARGPGPARVLVDLALSDHRPVAPGVTFPFRQELFVDGRLLVRATVRAVTVNAGLPEALFHPDALRPER
jgi:hypothetical protein